jgi:hypothetical protein
MEHTERKRIAEFAEKMITAGFSVIPVNIQTKAPIIERWKDYQTAPMRYQVFENKILRSRANVNVGVALIGGVNNTYCIDFDDYKAPDEAAQVRKDIESSIKGAYPYIFDKINIETTPRGGTHWIFRISSEAIKPNQKICTIKDASGKHCEIIETKGFGGYVLVSPSKGYNNLHNDINDLEPLTKEEYECIMFSIQSHDDVGNEKNVKPRKTYIDEGITGAKDDAFKDYNRKETPNMLSKLEGYGWTIYRDFGHKVQLSKPNASKAKNHATLDFEGQHAGKLQIFTPKTSLEIGRYDAVQLFIDCEAGGNAKKAKALLIEAGYGKESNYKDAPIEDGKDDFIKMNLKSQKNMFANTPEFAKSPKERANLPEVLQILLNDLEGRKYDLSLLHAIGLYSGALQNVRGVYDYAEECNIYAFGVAPAGFGKGVCGKITDTVKGIDLQKRARTDAEMVTYLEQKKQVESANKRFTEPKPPEYKLMIDSNATKAKLIQDLVHNGFLLLTDTEGDTLSSAIKGNHGDFSDVLRKCLHGERVGSALKTEGEVYVDNPRLSIAITATLDQVKAIMGNSGNGLLSRFSMYVFTGESEFKCPLLDENKKRSLKPETIQEVTEMITAYNECGMCTITPTQEQAQRVQAFGDHMTKFCNIIGDDAQQIRNRTALQMIRIACILQNLDRCHQEVVNNIRTTDMMLENKYFNIAQDMANTLFYCNLRTLSLVKDVEEVQESKGTEQGELMQIFTTLPDTFKYKELTPYADDLGVSVKTLMKRVKELITAGAITKTGTTYRKKENDVKTPKKPTKPNNFKSQSDEIDDIFG